MLLEMGDGTDKKLLGFMHDIGAEPADLNYATSLFFITFVIFQPISAAVGRWVGPKHWIPFMMVRHRLSLLGTRDLYQRDTNAVLLIDFMGSCYHWPGLHSRTW